MIKISTDYRYEYSKTELEGSVSKYIYVPLSVITNTELDIKRIGIFSYLRIRCGLDDVVGFTVPRMVEWCGMKPNKRTDKINDKFLNVLDDLNNIGYLSYLTEKSKSTFMECKFNSKHYFNDCSNGYSVIYLDEIEKIINYKKENSNDNILTNTTILLVFAYLRHKIKRRPNELKPEEQSPEMIEARRKRMPEAYDSNINEIAEEIGISSKTLSKIIDILEYDLKLIVTDRIYRIRNEDDEFRTPPTVFANAYKREDKYSLVTDEEYSRDEIKLKVEQMKKYYQNYKIDKRKRKNN